MSQSIALGLVFEALDQCAAGHARRLTTHSVLVKYKGRIFPLPKGGHGERRPEAEIGHVVKMVRFLGLDAACVVRAIPVLAERMG